MRLSDWLKKVEEAEKDKPEKAAGAQPGEPVVAAPAAGAAQQAARVQPAARSSAAVAEPEPTVSKTNSPSAAPATPAAAPPQGSSASTARPAPEPKTANLPASHPLLPGSTPDVQIPQLEDFLPHLGASPDKVEAREAQTAAPKLEEPAATPEASAAAAAPEKELSKPSTTAPPEARTEAAPGAAPATPVKAAAPPSAPQAARDAGQAERKAAAKPDAPAPTKAEDNGQEEASFQLRTLPRHIQSLARMDAEEVAQNSYKRSFKESRDTLLERLLDPPLSLEDAARILNVCPTTVRRYTNRGVLPHFRTVGNQRRFRLSDIIMFMETQQQGRRRGRGQSEDAMIDE